MTYKLTAPLLTRHVEPWSEYIFANKVLDKSQPTVAATAVRKAVEFGWFDGEKPNVDDMPPVEVLELSTLVFEAFGHAMGFDTKNLPGKPQTSPKN
jgi:hypothetical protein